MAANKRIYKVRFFNQGRIFEVYAREVSQSGLFGFIEVAKLVWGAKSDVIIDPTEQELKNEFQGVERTYIPLHAVIRIDEVEKTGTAKVIPLSGGESAQPHPMTFFPPGGQPGKKQS